MTDEEFHKKLLELAREFYKSGDLSANYSFTYVDIGCPYNGNMNPISIEFYYPHGRPTKEKAWKYEKE